MLPDIVDADISTYINLTSKLSEALDVSDKSDYDSYVNHLKPLRKILSALENMMLYLLHGESADSSTSLMKVLYNAAMKYTAKFFTDFALVLQKLTTLSYMENVKKQFNLLQDMLIEKI